MLGTPLVTIHLQEILLIKLQRIIVALNLGEAIVGNHRLGRHFRSPSRRGDPQGTRIVAVVAEGPFGKEPPHQCSEVAARKLESCCVQKTTEGILELLCRLVPFVRVTPEGTANNRLQGRGNVGPKIPERLELCQSHPLEELNVRQAPSVDLPGEEFVEHNARRKEVRPCVERFPLHLLGRHVPILPLKDPRLGP